MKSRAIVRTVILARAGVTAILGANPADKVVMGIIPRGATPPTIGIAHISSVDRVPLANDKSSKTTSRIQITVIGKDLKQADALMKQVRLACCQTIPFAGVLGKASVTLDGTGPDFEHEAGFIALTQDVRVIYADA